MSGYFENELRKEITKLKEELKEKERFQEYQRLCIGELKYQLHERDVIIPQKETSEYREKLAEAEKELGYYRWYEQHIEQQRSDTFYDMRNGNEYRTRVGCRAAYRKEMELKEIEWRNKPNS